MVQFDKKNNLEQKISHTKSSSSLKVLRWFIKILSGLIVLSLIFIFILYIAFAGRNVNLPKHLTEIIETQVNLYSGFKKFNFEKSFIKLQAKNLRPEFTLTDVSISSVNDQKIQFPEVKIGISLIDLFQGSILPKTIQLIEPEVKISRDKTGSLGFDFLNDLTDPNSKSSSETMLKFSLSKVFDQPIFHKLEQINTKRMSLLYEDKRNDKTISFVDVQSKLHRKEGFTELNINASLEQPNKNVAKIFVSLKDNENGEASEIRIKCDDLDSLNLSKQVYSTGWLKYFDGLVSVAITGLLTPAGIISEFAGTITLENGFVRNLSEDNPHFLDNAKTYIKYNAEDQRMYFDTIIISSPELKLEGEGHADILDFVSGVPETFIGQLKFNKIVLHPDGLSDSAMKFIDGMLDFRYSLSNSMMEIGQLMLRTDDTTLTSSGAVYLKESEWHINLDTKLGVTEYSNILDLWPTNFKPKSRIWFSENIKSGKIKNAVSSIRLSPEEDLQAMTTFDFVDAEIQVLKNHPNIKGGFGYGTIKNNKFFVKLDSGKVDGLNERKIDLSGSDFFVADTTQKPAIGEFIIFANGYTKDILTDLNKEPVRLLENSKITPNDINGVSQIRAELIMELRNNLEPNEVDYQVIDNIKNFKSNTIIKGRTLSAKELRFEGNNQEFLVSGNAFLDEFPFTYSWNKEHGVTLNDESIVNGTLTLSRESFKALNVEIPNEMMIGEANADFKITLKKNAYPDISVFSNLVGTELNIKLLDWKKKADESGELLLTMTLKEGPEDINFKLTAPRLKAIADFDLSLEGKVKSLNFSNLKIKNKFNGQVKVTPKTSSSGIVIGVTSPELDIRNYTFSSDNRTSDTVIYLDISKLIINDLVSLNDLNGKFNNTDIVDSYFTGNINSGPEIKGSFDERDKKLVTIIKSDTGGEVLQAMGMIKGARGGELTVEIGSLSEEGNYSGDLILKNVRLKKAPILADLLSATSVFGLIEQLSGDGILFTDSEAKFILRPRGVELKEASAIGASLGVSMDGIYDIKGKELDMQGVISPMYTVNGMLLGKIFAPRDGEGLIGFNYSILGPLESPKVSINPLSIFTPGIFREIFRRPVPKLKQ